VKSNHTYKLNRYKVSFLDYKIATEKFNDAVFNISQNGPDISESIETLARVLNIKHDYFLACASRLLSEIKISA
jgi:hypothetical protein